MIRKYVNLFFKRRTFIIQPRDISAWDGLSIIRSVFNFFYDGKIQNFKSISLTCRFISPAFNIGIYPPPLL